MSDVTGLLEKIKSEVVLGGDLKDMPCPFCGLPRCSRSDYIRCSQCGINWSAGEDPSKDPRIDRFKDMVASMRKPGPQSLPEGL
jgi:uncharacterized Zn finger protein (UPF0148 family)